MPLTLHATASRRLLAALLACGYFWLCVVLPWQHTHAHHDKSLSSPTHRSASPQPDSVRIAASVQAALSPAHQATHCSACDWEALCVPLTLPVLNPTLEIPHSLPVITTFPRYLHRYVNSTPSRAPPLT